MYTETSRGVSKKSSLAGRLVSRSPAVMPQLVRRSTSCLSDLSRLQDCLLEHYVDLIDQLTRRFGCADIAAETVHELWLRLNDSPLGKLPPLRSPRAYLYRMAVHTGIDKLRSSQRYQNLYFHYDDQFHDRADPLARVEDIVACRALLRVLDEIIHSLPNRRRAIFVAVRVEQMERREVAAMFGITARSVAHELRHAEKFCIEQMLKRSFAPYYAN